MAVHQLPAEIGAFARYLRDLTSLLDPGDGWYGVFRERDPEGLRACFAGTEIPPWDVVDSLLQDFAAGRDPQDAARESARARRLHAASAAAYDRLSGGAEALSERLQLMLREQAYLAGRAEELGRLLRTAPQDTPHARQLSHELAWIRDDHARATARVAELRARLTSLTTPGRATPTPRPLAPEGWFRAEESSVFDRGASPDAASGAGRTKDVPQWVEEGRRVGAPAETPAPAPAPAAAAKGAKEAKDPKDAKEKKRASAPKRKPRGARFAGLEVEEEAEEAVPAPALPVPPPAAPATPRGARFGGAPVVAAPAEAPPEPSVEDLRAAAELVRTLAALRAGGRSGEAHVVLCEAAGRPPGQLPLLADELHRAGLGADWAELLWEAAFLPPTQLAAAAGALSAAGRDEDCRQLLLQGVSRPAEEITDAVLALGGAGRAHEARALLCAFVQARAPEDAVLVAAPDPHRLVPQLIEAAREVSVARERDVVHALRVAGIADA